MADSSYWRSSVADCMLDAAPPIVREALLDDSSFLREYGVRTDSTLSLGGDLVVQRSVLYGAIRSALSSYKVAYFLDSAGRECRVEPIERHRDVGGIILYFGSSRVEWLDHGILSDSCEIRLGCFAALCRVAPIDTASSWRAVLAKRSLSDDEVYELRLDLADTSARRAEEIRDTASGPKLEVAALVPRSRRYFERLVGKFDGSASVRDYASGAGRRHICALMEHDRCQGLLSSLLLSSHSSLVKEIDVERVGADDLMRLFVQVEKKGDLLSQVGIIEIGFRLLETMPDVEPILIRLIERVRDDDVGGPMSRVRLMAALFVLVDAELSRMRLLSDRPAFYRRLAAMAHAGLLHRIFGDSSAETGEFADWMVTRCWGRFVPQVLIDLRTEPRWSFELAEPAALHAEFVGRIVAGAVTVTDGIRSERLRQLVDLSHPNSVCRGLSGRSLWAPGPLEGVGDPAGAVSVGMNKQLDEGLAARSIEPAVCAGLGSLARVADVKDHVRLLEKRLEDLAFRFYDSEERGPVSMGMVGLATVSAITRNVVIADRLRLLVHQYRRDAGSRLSAVEAVVVVLTAAASRSDKEEWMEFVGGALTELAFGELSGNEGEVLQGWLRSICDIVPELWRFCGRADAALAAYNGRLTQTRAIDMGAA